MLYWMLPQILTHKILIRNAYAQKPPLSVNSYDKDTGCCMLPRVLIRKILIWNALAQKPHLSVYAAASSNAIFLIFGLSLHLHPHFVYANNEGSGESVDLFWLSFSAPQCLLTLVHLYSLVVPFQLSLDAEMHVLLNPLHVFIIY